ncbi:MAG: hypothetical protein KME28_13150 [Pelatocladus maniniholoensis HA4357-MV3]|jgi:2-phospho-L-lactate guanylyltransferase (CobY/MobA/RfbA family)|uniref:Uncharacterized protein n=1 Tax=Pelatocladus maniniholoensis HA4357-MV3 TaxID=1117104 RepID=A0A9E3LTV9_9NOST|nr:hypothetical protein [Pelatocladus maniniholoensis HA4357-MV3]BAZ65549.1 hypothetical protein NIES4106_02880 [Fischerella sp. NIES-4106]
MTDQPSRLDRIEQILAITASQQQANTAAIAELTKDVSDLTEAIADYIVEAETDREVIKQNQAEIRRIWEYLLKQGGNGNGSSS